MLFVLGSTKKTIAKWATDSERVRAMPPIFLNKNIFASMADDSGMTAETEIDYFKTKY